MRIAITIGAVAVLALAGCGESGSPAGAGSTPTLIAPTTGAPESSAPTTATPTAEPSTTVSAAALAAKLKTGVSSITKVVQIDEKNDKNDLIGRPNGYSDAAVLYDSGATCTEPGADCGATIEIWPTAAAAKARAAYIQKIYRDNPALGSEYDYLDGAVLLRVTGKLKPSVSKQYGAVFGGQPYSA